MANRPKKAAVERAGTNGSRKEIDVEIQARKDKKALEKFLSLAKSPHLSEVDIARVVDECSAILSYRLEKSALFKANGQAIALPGECWELSGADGDPSNPNTPVSVKRNRFKVRDSTLGQVIDEGIPACG